MKLLKNLSIFMSSKHLNLNLNNINSNLKRCELKINRNYSVNINNIDKNWSEDEDNRDKQQSYDWVHPYRNLYNWKSMREFTEMLSNNIVYNDGNLIAICKPWGVGIYRSNVNITEKNSHLLNNVYYGSPKYCINDSLEPLSQLIGVKRLKVVKSIDRFMSGIVLLASNELSEKSVIKSISRSKPMEIPFMKFWCITKGWPLINGPFLRERVGIKLLEIDELGDHKEAIIINSDKLTNSMRRRQELQSDGLSVKTVLSEMRTLQLNKSLSAALIEISLTSTKWNFIQCYLANTASFVLGDVRFSRRVKHIFGTPMSVNPKKLNFDDNYEPLSPDMCKALKIKGNSYIPLMIHLKSLTLPKYLKKNDLIIDTNIPVIPEHFMWTLNRLKLKIPVNKELT